MDIDGSTLGVRASSCGKLERQLTAAIHAVFSSVLNVLHSLLIDGVSHAAACADDAKRVVAAAAARRITEAPVKNMV